MANLFIAQRGLCQLADREDQLAAAACAIVQEQPLLVTLLQIGRKKQDLTRLDLRNGCGGGKRERGGFLEGR